MENELIDKYFIKHVKLYAAPIDNIEIIEPIAPPNEMDVLLGYEIVTYDGCLVKPRPMKMSITAWLLSGTLAILCFPLMCIPCCLKSSYNVYQRPVYQSSYRNRRV